ncbi:hypothetical protein [Haloglycomyces albus]|uniref:hypothetical protein n=1 Tax=Haloglycomyces albus TaxID=526067 RepID=UPI00046D5DDC|nr:hypothetical protein [Haloglycomyces albus]
MEETRTDDSFPGFANPVVPTAEEIRDWAMDPTAPAPDGRQWDLLLAEDELISTWLELAANHRCPKRSFALHVLYIYASSAVRTRYRIHSEKRLEKLLEKAEESGDEYVGLWRTNTRRLMAKPKLFNYNDWCNGGLVYRPRQI